ncbi:MAG: hypothetical protein M0Q53_13975 [Prolixibacteraceae bacterium]|nr:hypothetical protein [Prolixibacteraceae bacterium]
MRLDPERSRRVMVFANNIAPTRIQPRSGGIFVAPGGAKRNPGLEEQD